MDRNGPYYSYTYYRVFECTMYIDQTGGDFEPSREERKREAQLCATKEEMALWAMLRGRRPIEWYTYPAIVHHQEDGG